MQGQACTELTTKRLYLRIPTEADAGAVRSVGSDEFEAEEAARQYIRWVHNRAYEDRLVYCFFIWLSLTGQCIGRVYLHSKPELNGEVEIGYRICEDRRRMGYATEAAKAVIQFDFEQAGLEVLSAIVKPDNTPSRRVIGKLGFTKRGVRMVPDEHGRACVFDYFQLHRDDWRSGQSMFPSA